MNVLELARQKGLDPRRKGRSAKRGEEWVCACPSPGCSKTDGFIIWPEQNNGEGSWFCRNCPEGRNGGDTIAFLMCFDGLTYKEACLSLGKDMDPPAGPIRARQPGRRAPDAHRPNIYESPKEQWREHAVRFVQWSHEKLLGNDQQIAKLEKRGLKLSAIKRWGLGWNPGKEGKDLFRPRESWGLETIQKKGRKKKLWLPRGLVIPYYRGGILERIRIRRPRAHLRDEKDPRYYIVPGSSAATWLIGEKRRAYIVVETELDGLLIDHLASDLAGVVMLGSCSVMPDAYCHTHLCESLVILNSLDFDKAGARAWNKWPAVYPQSERWPAPEGKDPGAAFEAGIDIRTWILAGLPPAWRIGRSKKSAAAAGGVAVESAPADPPGRRQKEPDPIEADHRLPAAIIELGDLLRRHPVTVISDATRTAMKYPRSWNNEPVGKKISQLIFFDSACKNYLDEHPEEIITGKNFFLP